MRAVLFGSHDAYNPAASADERAFIADVRVSVDFDHHRTVRDRRFGYDCDDVETPTFFRYDIRSRLIVRVGGSGADGRNDRLHSRYLFGGHFGICWDLKRPDELKLSVLVAEALAGAQLSPRDPAADAAVAAEKGVLCDRIFRKRAGLAVLHAGQAMDAVIVHRRFLIDDFYRRRGANLLAYAAADAFFFLDLYHPDIPPSSGQFIFRLKFFCWAAAPTDSKYYPASKASLFRLRTLRRPRPST